jgi:hypothetical protein
MPKIFTTANYLIGWIRHPTKSFLKQCMGKSAPSGFWLLYWAHSCLMQEDVQIQLILCTQFPLIFLTNSSCLSTQSPFFNFNISGWNMFLLWSTVLQEFIFLLCRIKRAKIIKNNCIWTTCFNNPEVYSLQTPICYCRQKSLVGKLIILHIILHSVINNTVPCLLYQKTFSSDTRDHDTCMLCYVPIFVQWTIF